MIQCASGALGFLFYDYQPFPLQMVLLFHSEVFTILLYNLTHMLHFQLSTCSSNLHIYYCIWIFHILIFFKFILILVFKHIIVNILTIIYMYFPFLIFQKIIFAILWSIQFDHILPPIEKGFRNFANYFNSKNYIKT